MIRTFLLSLIFVVPSLAAKPNIVFILADDLGYGDLSCYGQKHFKTPAIDALAADGIRFTDHYAGATVCAPSRCSLMTGKHTGHAAIRGNGPVDLPAGESTVATLLQQAGYETALIGKSSVTGNTQTPESLSRHGFAYFYGTTDHRDAHFRYPKFLYENSKRIDFPDNRLHSGNHYDLDLYTDQTLAYIDRQSDAKPFFLVFSIPLPHASLVAPEDSMVKARASVGSGKKVKMPAKHPHYTEVAEPKASYAALVIRMDDAVAKVTAKLREKGMHDNTLVIFTSDNGSHSEGGYQPLMLDSSGPFRGHKRDLYEGGIRVPFVVRWPASIKPSQTSAHPSAFWDFLPTACEIAGAPVPAGLDGISFLSTLLGSGDEKPHDFLYWEFHEQGGRRALRSGDWKLVQYGLANTPPGPLELYNIKEDPAESNNLAAGHPDVLKSLMKKLDGARQPSALFPLPPLDPAAKD